MRIFPVGLSAVLAVALLGPVHAGTRITAPHPEREKMSQKQRRDRVMGDLESILTGPSSPTTIATKPYASSTNGLCQRDVIQLQYARTSDDEDGGRFRPVGIGVAVQYHFRGWVENESRAAMHKACARLANKKIYWAYGDNDHRAATALSLLKLTVDDVRKNQRFTVDCRELDPRKIETSCTDIFLTAAEQIQLISRDYDKKDDSYEFGSTPYRISIIRTFSPLMEGGYSTAIKVAYEEIVVT